ncbi:MAG: gliding motility-associated ABC transporter substrate-binding protein GldG [Bacteroidales bacterium]|nr:gliding motility-associated ABC transporter substrate-binding protein GldG [Candidatus Colimorpha pelethequi]
MKKDKDNKKRNLRQASWIELGAGILLIIFANIISNYLFARIDLTAEKRYSLTQATKQLVKSIDEPVLFRVYLKDTASAPFPADFKRLQNETKQMLNQMRAYNKNIQYEFVNPNSFTNPEERRGFYQKLIQKGIQPTQIQTGNGSGMTQTIDIVPAATVTYKGRETAIQLLQQQKYVSQDELLNNSIQNLEYVLSNAIRSLARVDQPRIGFLAGHGELGGGNLYDIQSALQEYYALSYVSLDSNINVLTGRQQKSDSSFGFYNKYDLLIVSKPTQAFNDKDLYILDQYVMYGGKILWLIDPLDADLDSLARQPQMAATRYNLRLDEMLFNYGVRINPDIIMDVRCRPIPMAVGMVGDKPQLKFCPWYYFPEIVPTAQHPIVRNLDLIKTDFVSSIDLIDNDDDVEKTVLLTTSEYSRVKNAPAIIDLNDGKIEPDQRLYNKQNLPIAVLLEGSFKSMFRNRLSPEFTEQAAMGFKESSKPTKMIVISDGDMIKNRYNYNDGSGYPMGYDNYTNTLYANKEFILNAANYLTGDEGFMSSRSREIKLRKMDAMKIQSNRTKYQLLNVLLPSAIILAAGAVILFLRKRKWKK